MTHDHAGHDHDCDACGGKSFDQIRQETTDTILEHGHQVRFIFPAEDDRAASSPFFYTVGRSLWSKPELLMTGGLPPKVGMFLLNEACRMQDAGEVVIEHGAEFPADTLLASYPCRIIRCDPTAAEMLGATSINPDCEAYQIVWPDVEGRFPGDPGYSVTTQPLFPLEVNS